jgi:hypothetical protein
MGSSSVEGFKMWLQLTYPHAAGCIQVFVLSQLLGNEDYRRSHIDFSHADGGN